MTAGTAALPRIDTLFDAAEGEALPLPPALREAYGELRLPPTGTHVFANFVSTLDGLVSYGIPGAESARFISGGHRGDRFVMGLLRAVADAVVSGAGTLRAEPKVTWTPRQIYPQAADLYAELRRARGLGERTRVAILSGSGEVDPSLPVFRSADVDALLVTSRAGAEHFAAAGGSGVRTRVTGDTPPAMREAIAAVADAFGARLILSEAGPTLFGRMLGERAVDELFLTLAPRLAGRSAQRNGIALVHGTAFDPDRSPAPSLVSIRRSEDFLLLRYRLTR